MDARKILLGLAIKFDGDWFKIYDSIYTSEYLNDDELEKIAASNPFKFITMLDPEYPEYLKRCFRPPFVLFYEGDISLLNNIDKHLGVVGTRKPTDFYRSETYKIISQIPNDIVIVSGLALGIDGVAHRAAIDSNKKTIAVIGCGLDLAYPLENKKLSEEIKRKGLVISEYPKGSLPDSKHFPLRNRLIAFFSKSIFLPEAYPRSGSIITVGYALETGKEVYCLPSVEFGKSACNMLIKEGANLVENAEDIMDFFH